MTPAQKAFEEFWTSLSREKSLPAMTEQEYLVFVWKSAWKARGEHDAKICEEEKVGIADETDNVYNQACTDCAEAIRKADV